MQTLPTASFAISILSLGWTTVAHAASPITPVALDGEPAPGLIGIAFLLDSGVNARPVVNESNKISFLAQGSGAGVWIGDTNALELLIHTSGPAPGTPSGVFIENFNYVQFGPANDAMIHGRLRGPGIGLLENGIWFGPTNDLQLIARDGDDAPGTATGIVFDRFGFMSQPSMAADTRAVAFLANIAGDGVTQFVNDSGIWTGPVDDDLSLVARIGEPAEGFQEGINYQTLYPPTLNRSGAIAFIGRTSDFKTAVWTGTNSTLERVIVGFEPVPGTPGASVSAVNNVGLDNQGRLKIVGEFFGSVSGWGILSGIPGDLEFIVHEGQQAPIGDESTTANFSILLGTPILAAGSGDVGFAAFLTGPEVDPSNQLGIWVANTEEVRLLARTGDQAPGLPPGVVYTNLNNFIHMNNSGMIVFESELAGPGIEETNNFGYFGGNKSNVRLIFREGDLIETSPGVIQVIDSLPSLRAQAPNPNPQPLGNNANGTSAINDQGVFVFQASFDDETGTEGGVFAMQLSAPQLELIWSRTAEGLQLSWPDDSGITLLEADEADGSWSPAGSQLSPQVIVPSGSRQFFQLSR